MGKKHHKEFGHISVKSIDAISYGNLSNTFTSTEIITYVPDPNFPDARVLTAGAGILFDDTAPTALTISTDFTSFVAGANISIVPVGDTIVFSGSAGAGGGTVTEIVPVGAGESLLQGGAVSDVGPVVQLRSFVEGSGVTITAAADTLTIAANTGAGTTIAPSDQTFLTLTDESAILTNARRLVAGTNVSFVDGGAGTTLTINATGGGGGAPTTSQYLTLAADATLTNERILTAGTNISFVDAGAGSTLTINATGGGGGAPTTASYVTLGTDATLTNERVLTGGTRILLEDAGAGNEIYITARTGAGFGLGRYLKNTTSQVVAPAADDLFIGEGIGGVDGGQAEPNFTFSAGPNWDITIAAQGWVNGVVQMWAKLASPSAAASLDAEFYQDGVLIDTVNFATNLTTTLSFVKATAFYINHPVNGTYTVRIRNNYAVNVEFGFDGASGSALFGIDYLGGANP